MAFPLISEPMPELDCTPFRSCSPLEPVFLEAGRCFSVALDEMAETSHLTLEVC